MLRASSPVVEAQLSKSIKEGLDLLGRSSLIIDFSDDQRWKAARKEWIDRTDETLDRIYEGSQEVQEFESAANAQAAGQPWQVEYNDSSSLRTALDVLVSLQDRLDDYAPGNLDDAAPAPDVLQNGGYELSPGHSIDVDPVPMSPLDPEPRGSLNVEVAQPMTNAVGSSLSTQAAARSRTDTTQQVFLVHGRDEKLKDTVAALLERAGSHPVTILNERPTDRRMLVEHPQDRTADSRHAVILLTADDVAGPRLDSGPEPHFSSRARQGVVFEMGVLVAALTPRRLCVLYEEGVERPCDIDGITYVRLDPAGAWQSKLLLHLRGAGFDYDLNMLAPI